MAVTQTDRFGIDRPGADADPYSRPQYLDLIDALEASGARFAQGLASARPSATAARIGLVYASTDTLAVDYCTGTVWLPLTADPTKTVPQERTFAFSGASLDTSAKGGFFVRLPGGVTRSIVGARVVREGGTSATVTIARNGGTLASPVVTTSAADVAITQALADDDLITCALTAVSGTVTAVFVTLFLDAVV